jgi:acyl-CoA synthetase (NDP forming)
MSRRLSALPLLVLAGAMALTGCGGGGSSTTTKSTPAAASTSTTSGVPANLQKAVAECHHLIETQKALSANAKTKLSAACDKAGKGDTQAVKQAAREVCEEVIEKAPSLPSSAKESALASCRK